jgi:hypothetical protein
LEKLFQEYSSNTIVGAKAIEEMEGNPTLKNRIVNALKEAGAAGLEKLIDRPAVSIVIAGAKGFIDG